MENKKEEVVLVQFDLEKLRGKKVAVHCETEERAKIFINWVNSLGEDLYDTTHWNKKRENTCYRLAENLCWDGDSKSSLEEQGYEIVSYEEALLKESKNEPKNNKEEAELVKFDLEKLRGKIVGVNCVTEEQAQTFVNWVVSLGVEYHDLAHWESHKEDTCYALEDNLRWRFVRNGGRYKIISYEEALTKESLLKVSEEKDEKINNLSKTILNKDSIIENHPNEINEKVNKVSCMYEGQLKVHENEIKRLHTIIHYLEEKCLKIYED